MSGESQPQPGGGGPLEWPLQQDMPHLGFCTLIPVSYGMSQDEGKAPPAGVTLVTQGHACEKCQDSSHRVAAPVAAWRPTASDREPGIRCSLKSASPLRLPGGFLYLMGLGIVSAFPLLYNNPPQNFRQQPFI